MPAVPLISYLVLINPSPVHAMPAMQSLHVAIVECQCLHVKSKALSRAAVSAGIIKASFMCHYHLHMRNFMMFVASKRSYADVCSNSKNISFCLPIFIS